MDINYPCICCGYLSRTELSQGDYDICPICFWEDDPLQNEEDLDYSGGANAVPLKQARINFKKFKAIEKRFIKNVREPLSHEIP
ncbi:hypothetical protein M2263_004344 [Providencia alcalifaciens]|nr:hypothetical protein [Providencia alcalifaciens]